MFTTAIFKITNLIAVKSRRAEIHVETLEKSVNEKLEVCRKLL